MNLKNYMQLFSACLLIVAQTCPNQREIPEILYEEYTMAGNVPAYSWCRDDSYSDDKPRVYSKDQLDSFIREAHQKKTQYYGATDIYLYQALEKYAAYIQQKDVAILGSVIPWYESIILAYNGLPTTIEYNKIISEDARLKVMTVAEYDINPKKFDALLSISSFEHDGLGRYGDPLDPNGDIKAMQKAKTMLKEGGLLFLAVPIGQDALVWNVHRIYGERRLPVLLEGWEIIDSFGFNINDLQENVGMNGGHQPIFVLRNGNFKAKTHPSLMHQASAAEFAITGISGSSGRLGDDIYMYAVAKWLAYKYNISFYATPFKYFEDMAIDTVDQIISPEVDSIFRKRIELSSEDELVKHLKTSGARTLFGVTRMINIHPASHMFVSDCCDDILFKMYALSREHPIFCTELKKALAPKKYTGKLDLPPDKISIALHIRKGSGRDDFKEQHSIQYLDEIAFQDNYKNYKFNPNVTYNDKIVGFKFPPEQFFVDQVLRLSELFNHYPLFVYVFTDAKDPNELIKRLKKRIQLPSITFASRQDGDDRSFEKDSILEDLYDMAKFDCLVRPESGFSAAAQLIGNHKIVIYPRSFAWINAEFEQSMFCVSSSLGDFYDASTGVFENLVFDEVATKHKELATKLFGNAMSFHSTNTAGVEQEPSIISNFIKNEDCLKQEIEAFFAEKDFAKITDLCRSMTSFGSDKGDRWLATKGSLHNYTTLYERLFRKFKNQNVNLFEIGLGTNDESIPSNMGRYGCPGASLHGWADFFPKGSIFGGDIDKKILFNTDKIKTFYCDQLDKNTIEKMWLDEKLKNIYFDIIIDDGLHTFEANLTFLENSLSRLRKGGLFIIEDLKIHTKHLFNEKAAELVNKYGLQSFFTVTIPLEGNNSDNCLAIILK